MGTQEAADRLGVSRNRVGDLIRQGTLQATRVGRIWVVDEVSLNLVEAQGPGGRTRPLLPVSAWAVALIVEGHDPKWLAPDSRDRLMRRIAAKRRATTAEWAAWMRRRSTETVGVWIHPELSDRLGNHLLRFDIEDVPSGLKVEGGNLHGWTSHSGLVGLVQDEAVLASSRPNTIVRVWPREVDKILKIPGLIAAADLLEADDSRSRRMGEWLMDRTLAHVRA